MNQQAIPSGPSLRTSPVLGWKTSTPFTFARSLPSFSSKMVMSGSPKMTKRLPLPEFFFEVIGHVQIGIHPGLEDRDAAQLIEFRGVRLIIESAGDENIEIRVARLAGGKHQVLMLDSAKLRADENRGALFCVAFPVAAIRANQIARPQCQRGEGDLVLLVRLLDASGFKVLQDLLREALLRAVFGAVFFKGVDQLIVLIHSQHAVWAEAFDSERAGHANLLFVLVGLVVEVNRFRIGDYGGVDFLLPGNTGLPPVSMKLLCWFQPCIVCFTGNFPFLPLFLERGIQLFTQGLQYGLPLVPNNINRRIVGN